MLKQIIIGAILGLALATAFASTVPALITDIAKTLAF